MSGTIIHANNVSGNQRAAARGFSWSVPETVCCVLVFAIAFVNLIDLSGSGEFNTPNPQVLIKTLLGACCGLFGLYGAFNWPRVSYVLMSLPTGIFLLIGFIFLVSIPFSIDPLATAVATVLYWCMLLFVISAIHVLGSKRMLHVIAAGFFSFVIGSWLAVFLLPGVGIFQEVIGLDQIQLRMGGLTHPNTLAMICSLLLLLLIYFAVHERVSWKFLACPLLITSLTLLLTLSRTSMAAFVLAAILVNRRALFHKNMVVIACVGAMSLVLAIFVGSLNWDLTTYAKDFFLKFSKSGSLEELTTGTGRIEIWKFTIEKISEAPWLGKGLATAKIVMAEYSGHPHNMWLSFFYSGGILCGLLSIILTVYLLLRVVFRPLPAVDGVVTFILLSGIAEPVVLSPIPGGPLMLLIVATAWTTFNRKTSHQIDAARNGQLG